MRRFVLTLALVLVAAVAILAACGNRDEEPTPTATAAAAPAQENPTAAQQSPVETATTADATLTSTVSAAPLTATASSELTAAATLTSADPATASAEAAAAACAIETSAELAGYSSLHERMGCPQADATVEQVAINEFGEGPDYNRFMLWFGNEQQIYVLQPDGAWLAYTDSWADSEPEILCNPDGLDPATSPPLPRRGFGKLWCGVASVREVMGSIDREERLCQHAVVQRFDQGRLLACFEDATIRYFRLLSDGSWDIEMVQ